MIRTNNVQEHKVDIRQFAAERVFWQTGNTGRTHYFVRYYDYTFEVNTVEPPKEPSKYVSRCWSAIDKGTAAANSEFLTLQTKREETLWARQSWLWCPRAGKEWITGHSHPNWERPGLPKRTRNAIARLSTNNKKKIFNGNWKLKQHLIINENYSPSLPNSRNGNYSQRHLHSTGLSLHRLFLTTFSSALWCSLGLLLRRVQLTDWFMSDAGTGKKAPSVAVST